MAWEAALAEAAGRVAHAQRVACLDIRHRLPSGSVGLLYRASHVHPRLDLLRAALAKCDFPT